MTTPTGAAPRAAPGDPNDGDGYDGVRPVPRLVRRPARGGRHVVVTRKLHEARGDPGLTAPGRRRCRGCRACRTCTDGPTGPPREPDHRASRTTARAGPPREPDHRASPAGVDGNARPGIAPPLPAGPATDPGRLVEKTLK